MGYKNRDVEIVWISDKQCLIIACDSCGAVGAKEADVIKASSEFTAQLITRNVLLEVLSVGAKPQMLTATIANEPEPTGNTLVKGIRQELERAHFDLLPIEISTEKNFTTYQTSFGITIIGLATKTDLRIGFSQIGDSIYCLGAPKVGEEILHLNEQELIQCHHIEKLLSFKGIHDIVPVGSQGIYGEVSLLAQTVNAQVEFESSLDIDIHKPAGPCACLLFTVSMPLGTCFFDGMVLSKVGTLS